jgi:tetratricopeptide (TPR) repeat protein
MKIFKHIIILALLSCALPIAAQVGPNQCGALKNSYGPFDYRGTSNPLSREDPMPITAKRALVEGAHFSPQVENLVRGQSAVGIIGVGIDIDYTLRAFPNNYRALMAVVRLGEKLKIAKPAGLTYEIECYFERALRFQENDNLVRMIYANYLAGKNRKQDALAQLKTVLVDTDGSPFTHQNVGLIYFDLGEFELALEQAHKSIDLGLEKSAIKVKLQSIGKWKDAEDNVTESTEAIATDSPPGKP